MKIILDTNFLVYCAKQKIDYKEEIDNLVKENYELVATTQVVRELRELKEKAKKFSDRLGAELALKLLKVNKVRTIRTKAKTAVTALIECMKKVKDPRIQVLCIQILGKIRDPRAIPVLKKALQSPFEYVLIAVLDALYQIRNEEALAILTLLFQHPNNDALPKALKELEIKESFIPIFLMALESPVNKLKFISMESLKKMLKNVLII